MRPLWMRLVSGGIDWKCLQGGQRAGERGKRGRHMVRIRRIGPEFEALGLLRTFQRGPAAAQWAVAGGAPPPGSMTALGRSHCVGTAESG